MADFSTWDRSTLEQFAQEATAKLIENRDAIDELLTACREALEFIDYLGITEDDCVDLLRDAIAKHSTTKEQ